MHNILQEIVDRKKRDLEVIKKTLPLNELKSRMSFITGKRDFFSAVSNKDKINIIAEIKKASPSAGVIRPEIDIASISKDYTVSGAAAISVLTEKRYFQGKLGFLSIARKSSALPVLRKDFIFDIYQVYESLVFGADAILLIAALFDRYKLKELMEAARIIGLDCLVEVHNEEDLAKVLTCPANIIGINNRNLNDFSIDKTIPQKLKTNIPVEKTIIVESGIDTYEDIELYRELGIDSFLVGSTLMKHENPGEKLKELLGEQDA